MEMGPPSYSHMITGCIFSELLVIHNDLLSNVCAATGAAVYSLMIQWDLGQAGAGSSPARLTRVRSQSCSLPRYQDSGHHVPSASSPGSEYEVQLL